MVEKQAKHQKQQKNLEDTIFKNGLIHTQLFQSSFPIQFCRPN